MFLFSVEYSTATIIFYIILIYLIAALILLIDQVTRVSIPSLSGKHIVITGGSSGIGKSVAVESAKAGAHVTIIARNKDKLDLALLQIKAACKNSENQKLSSIALDVCQSYEACRNALQTLENEVAPIDVFVNCAGSCVCGTIENDSEQNFRKMLDLNLIGTMLPTKYVIKSMIKRKEGGTIVITASQAALLGIYGMGAYCASKWGLRGFAETLHQELAVHNISVTLCLPPDTDTPGFEEENRGKPEETKLICQSGGLVEPDVVAKKLLSDALKRRFWSTTGLEGTLLTAGCAGFSPLSSVSEMGGDHHHLPKIPDWRIYKVEACPELAQVQRALSRYGLKDPWLRNEVWRYDEKMWGQKKGKILQFVFRGFKWGLAAAIVTVAIEKALTPSGHGHGSEAHAHH